MMSRDPWTWSGWAVHTDTGPALRLLKQATIVLVLFCWAVSGDQFEPTDLAVVKASYTFLQISWKHPENSSFVSHYAVKDHADQGDKYREDDSRLVPINESKCFIRGLSPGTSYTFYVVAYHSFGLHANSQSLSHITDGYGPDRPCNCSSWGSDPMKACNNHTGQCVCKNKYITGRRCDSCYRGYYIHDYHGCEKCNCADHLSDGTCTLKNGMVHCNCRPGHAGLHCSLCENGLYLVNGKCTPCLCNGNADLSSPEICDVYTGKCLACVNFTTGDYCEQCAHGYEGSALYHNCTKSDDLGPVMSHSSVVILITCFCLFVCLTLVLVAFALLRYRQKKNLHFGFWTARLRDDHENVNFSALMEQPDPRLMDPNFPHNDKVEFANKKQSLEFVSS